MANRTVGAPPFAGFLRRVGGRLIARWALPNFLKRWLSLNSRVQQRRQTSRRGRAGRNGSFRSVGVRPHSGFYTGSPCPVLSLWRSAPCLALWPRGRARCDEYLGVWVFGSRRKIFRNDRVVIEIRRCVEWFVNHFLFLHCFALLSSRAIFFVLAKLPPGCEFPPDP